MNTTNWTGITDFEGLLTEANTFAPFWTGVLYMIWIVVVITFLPFGMTTAVLTGSFLSFLLGIFLVYMGLVNWTMILPMLGVIVFLVIWETLFSKKET